MKSKILSLLNTTNKKIGMAIFCGALIVTIGAGTAFAANARNSLAVKMENGTMSYSTDEGKTWSKNAPEGTMITEENGKLTISNGRGKEGEEGKGLLTKVENGVTSYSTDGGNTWSIKMPEGGEESATIGED